MIPPTRIRTAHSPVDPIESNPPSPEIPHASPLSSNGSLTSVASAISSFGRSLTPKDGTDYLTVVKKDGETWSVAGLDICSRLHAETDNRNPDLFGMRNTLPKFKKLGELEVIENHLRVIYKHFKQATKKKSPQSSWRPVFASLEGLALYLRDKMDLLSDTSLLQGDTSVNARLTELFHAYGCAWVGTAARLSALGSFSENAYPSVRTVVHCVMAFGNAVNDADNGIHSEWPDKMESIWTGTVFAGDAKPRRDEEAEVKKKKKKGGKDAAPVEEKKKKLGRRKEQALNDPWDFKESLLALKGERKQIGGSMYDIALWTAEERLDFVKKASVNAVVQVK